MIALKTKDGKVWFATAFDRLTVTNAQGMQLEFSMDEVADIVVDTAGGNIATLEARRPDGGEFDVLQVTDGETGVPVKVLFDRDLFRQVGQRMSEPRIAAPSESDLRRFG